MPMPLGFQVSPLSTVRSVFLPGQRSSLRCPYSPCLLSSDECDLIILLRAVRFLRVVQHTRQGQEASPGAGPFSRSVDGQQDLIFPLPTCLS